MPNTLLFTSPAPMTPLFPHLWSQFRHDRHPDQPPMSVTRIPLTGERGKRTSWLYTARYFGGNISEHELPCPNVPLNLSRTLLGQKIQLLTCQRFKPKFFTTFPETQKRVFELLRKRLRPKNEKQDWRDIFSEFPASVTDPQFSYVFSYLTKLLGNFTSTNIQVIIVSG